MYENITSENVMMYAIRHNNNPQCEGQKEFQDDKKKISSNDIITYVNLKMTYYNTE